MISRWSLALPVLLAAAPLPAQTRDTVLLAPIVVTATRLPTATASTPASVTIITGEALRARGVTTALEALRGLPGVQISQSGSFGGITSLFVRGGESDYVRVLLDGVPLNQPGGAIDLAHLSTDNVDRIEVVRGPASVLYGSDAVSGVIQVFTRTAVAPRWSAQWRSGTFGTSRVAAEAAAGGPRAGVQLAGSRDASDGIYPVNNRSRQAALAARAHARPDARTEFGATARWTDATHHYPTDGNGAIADSNQYQTVRGLTASIEAARRLAPALTVRALAGLRESRDRIADAPDSPGDTLGFYAFRSRAHVRRTMSDVRADWSPAVGTTVSVGAALEWQRERSHNAYDASFGSDSAAVRVGRDNRALYTQLLAERSRVTVHGGMRVDDNDAFGTFLTTRAGVAVRATGSLWLRAAAGTAFKEPTFFENYAQGFTVGNPALRPERSASWEVGARTAWLGGRVTADVAWFSQRFRDMIQYFTPPAFGDPNYANIAGARARGAEAELRVAVTTALALTARYSLTRTSAVDSGVDGAQFAEGRRLIRRPTHAAGADAAFTPGGGRLTADVGVRWVGSRDDLDFGTFPAGRVMLPAYVRVDAAASVRLAGQAALTLRAENLLDRRYQEVVGFPARGRVLLAGMRFGAAR